MLKPVDKNLLNDLQSLGLSSKEAIVYVDLLEKSMPTGSSKIVHATGLHGQFVYNALYALEEKGLARHSIINGRKKFEATAPAHIADLIETKRLICEKTVEKLKVISTKKSQQEFETYQGEDSCIRRQFEMLEKMDSGAEILILSTRQDKNMTKKEIDFFTHYEKRRREKNISMRLILNEGLRKKISLSRDSQFKTNYRFLPEHQTHSSICIFGNHVDFHLLGDPIMIFSFENKRVSQGQRYFFEMLWELANQ